MALFRLALVTALSTVVGAEPTSLRGASEEARQMTNVTSTAAVADALEKTASADRIRVRCWCQRPYDACSRRGCYRSSRCMMSDFGMRKEAGASPETPEIPPTSEAEETAEAQNKPDIDVKGSAKESGWRHPWSCLCSRGYPYCSRHRACYRYCW